MIRPACLRRAAIAAQPFHVAAESQIAAEYLLYVCDRVRQGETHRTASSGDFASGGGVVLISASRSGSRGAPISKLRLAAATCTERQPAGPDLPCRRPGRAYRRRRCPYGAGLAGRGVPGRSGNRQGSRGLLGCPGVATGSPAARQAWNPPITSVALDSPRACRDAAASEEEYPWSQQMIHLTWWQVASGIRDGLAGSQRHSRWLRSMMMAPGISPSARRWNSGRVSMRIAPSCTARSARTGSRRARPDLAWRSRSSMVGGVVWWHRPGCDHCMFIAARALRARRDLGLEVLARPGGTVAVSLCPWCRAPCGPG